VQAAGSAGAAHLAVLSGEMGGLTLPLEPRGGAEEEDGGMKIKSTDRPTCQRPATNAGSCRIWIYDESVEGARSSQQQTLHSMTEPEKNYRWGEF